MSRKKPVPPRDPLCRQLYAKRAGRTLPQLRQALTAAGCSVSEITVKQWLRGRHRPGRFTRPLLAKALEKL
jgi:DNA-binding transcriptional regulator YiaG